MRTVIPATLFACCMSASVACRPPNDESRESLDASDSTIPTDQSAQAEPAPTPVTVVAPKFGVSSQAFEIWGGEFNDYVTPPPIAGYPFLVPFVQLRGHESADADTSVWWGATRVGSTYEFHGSAYDAPRYSHGLPNRFTGEVTVLGLTRDFGYSSSFRTANNGQTVTWPYFAGLNAATRRVGYFTWAERNGADDDVENEAKSVNGAHVLRTFNGNSASSATVQAFEIAPPPSVRVVVVPFTVSAVEPPRVVRVARTPGKKFVVLAGANSYLTCGENNLNFKITVDNTGTTESTSTVRVWNGTACSRVSGTMMLIEER